MKLSCKRARHCTSLIPTNYLNKSSGSLELASPDPKQAPKLRESTVLLSKRLFDEGVKGIYQILIRDKGLPKTITDRRYFHHLQKTKNRGSRYHEEQLSKQYDSTKTGLQTSKDKRISVRIELQEVQASIIRAKEEIHKFRQEIHAKPNTNSKNWIQDYLDLNKDHNLTDKVSKLSSALHELIAKSVTLSTTASSLDSSVNQSKQLLKEIKDTQIAHHKFILQEGKDTRMEGLSWVLKALWALNEPTPAPKHFPAFLDSKSIQTIIFLAEQSLHLQGLKHSLSLIDIPHSTRQKSTIQLLKSVKYRLLHPISNPCTLSLPAVVALKAQIHDTESLVKQQKESEIHRLTTECTLHNYEKKHGAPLKEIISAVIGADSTERYLSTIKKLKSKLETDKMQARTFSFSRKVNTFKWS